MKPSRAVARLFKTLTPDEMRQLAAHAKSSVPYFRHIQAGRRGMSCELAWRLSEAADKIGLVIPHTEFCEACKRRA